MVSKARSPAKSAKPKARSAAAAVVDPEGSPYDVVLHPYVTEKTMAQMERPAGEGTENKLEFVVRRTATKPQIKTAIERLFQAKVADVNTKIGTDGHKRAIVRFAPDVKAEEIATRVGIF